MARYIKANYKVAQHLRLEKDRNQLQDGNYLLWQADMLAFGKLIDLPQILEQIGGIALMAHEAREEQDGTVLRELPVATDPRFIIEPAPEAEETQPEEEAEAGKQPADQQPDAEPKQPEDGQADKEPTPDQQPVDPQPEPEADQQLKMTPAPEKPAAAPKKKTTKK